MEKYYAVYHIIDEKISILLLKSPMNIRVYKFLNDY